MAMICRCVVLWIACFPGFVIGTVSITFDPSKAPLSDGIDISCELTGSSSTSVTWNFRSTSTSCGLGFCAPDPSPHTYSMNGNVFNLTLASVTTGDCISYSCQDTNDATDITSNDLYVAYFDKNNVTTTEPGANTDGPISATTGCVLSATDLTVTWYKIENGIETDFTSDRPSPVNSTARSTCTRTCHTEEDEKVTSGFTHTEYNGSDYVEVEYKLTISHSSYTGSADQFTWTSAKYRLKGSCCCWCWWGCCYDDIGMCILCWLVFILMICIILYIVGIMIGIIWINTNCSCKCFYYCKDSDCCECCGGNTYVRCKCCASWPCGVLCNINQLPFWYQILWATIIGIPVALGLYMIWRCCGGGNGDVEPKEEKPIHETGSGNTRTGQKKAETKKNESKDSGAHIENEQPNQEKKRREQPPLPHGAGAAAGTILHGREDSDSAVSREHVHIQESGRTLPQRPMPGIPSANDRQGHDNKGRGLSATFNDEDHPLVAIDTPSQKKGALESLPEGTGGEGSVKKLKKKKKKSKDREDEM